MLIKKRYFVVLNADMEGVYCPLMHDSEWQVVKMFENEYDAMKAGNDAPLGRCFGFEVFEIGGGIDYSVGCNNEEK